MSKTVDERIVSMQFDNKNFESNVSTSMSTLDKLKKSLDMKDSAKGLDGLSNAAKKVDMSGIGSGVEAVKAKFSALQVMGITALTRITNSALTAGKKIVSALTIDPIKTGFTEYETKINSIQTIMSNTASKGTTMKDVTKTIDELNTYADKTIYNFAEMTRNIGTFTAAGIGLKESASAIQGIANLAAASGSTSQQASTAMYQLSQALAAGTVKLQDWNSVVNAGMGGEKFQEALKATAREHGVAVDDIIKKQGSFRESLQKGWITAEIMNETLNKFTVKGAKEYAKSMMESGKWTQKQADALIKEAQAMEDAATKVKTFTQLWDTLKEAAQSGWGKTWEILIGDFEEAQDLLTGISNTLGPMIDASSDARNNLLQGWKDLGGRNDIIKSFENVGTAILSIIKPVKEAFREIFPPTTAQQLKDITGSIKEFTDKLKVSADTADKIKRTFKGVFSVLDMMRKGLVLVGSAIGGLFGNGNGIGSLLDGLLSFTAKMGDALTNLNKGVKIDGLSKGVAGFTSAVSSGFAKALESVKNFGSVFKGIGSLVSKAASVIGGGLKSAFGWIADNLSLDKIFSGLSAGGMAMTGAGLFKMAMSVSSVLKELKETFLGFFGKGGDEKATSIKEKFSDIMDSISDTLKSFTTNIKTASLVSIAAAIGVLTVSLEKLAALSAADTAQGLAGMAAMFKMLEKSFSSINQTLKKFSGQSIIKAGVSLILFANSLKILSNAMVKLSSLSIEQVVKGLISLGTGMAILTTGLKAIDKAKVGLSTSIALLALAESCKILGDALVKFSTMSWDESGRGLAAMGVALAELVAAVSVLQKLGGFKSILGSASAMLLVQTLDTLANGLIKFSTMSWDASGRGIAAMGVALTEMVSAVAVLQKLSGIKSIIGSASIALLVSTLDTLANGLIKFSTMSWDESGRGLAAMGVALAEVAGITGALGKLAGFSGLLGSGTLVTAISGLGELAASLQKFASMSWEESGRGLAAMGVALAEVAGITGALGKLAGLSGLLGAGTLIMAVESLGKLATALQKFSTMSWDESGRGIAAMGVALAELAGITGVLGKLAGLSGLIGAGTILVAVQGLGDIADALKKFGTMSWDEIGRGLTSMGLALAEIAAGGLANTLSIIGAISIEKVATPLGVLADSVKKWAGVTVPPGLGPSLASLATGIFSFTLSGFGASALAEAAPAVGTMATSVQKWAGVTVPSNLGESLKSLAVGIEKFTLGGWGASTIATAAPAIGTMADSIKKWSSVNVPSNLGEQLSSLASGVKAFTFAFAGGWSLGAVVGPLGQLASSISKWNNVTIPTTLPTQLKSLADGVKSFTTAFVGGLTLGNVVGPLGQLASSVKKWNGVTVPASIGGQLSALAKGVKSFSFAFVGTWSMSKAAGPLGAMATAVKKWNGVKVPSGLGAQLNSLAKGISAFKGMGNLSSSAAGLSKTASALKQMSGINLKSAASGLNTFSSSLSKFAASGKSIAGIGNRIVNDIVKPITSAVPKLKSAGSNLISGLASGINSRAGSVKSAASKIVTSSVQAVTSKLGQFKTAGSKASSNYASGISSGVSKASSAMRRVNSAAASAAKGSYGTMYSAGAHLVNGFCAGISANSYKAAARARAMANAATKAAKSALDEHSPSKVFKKIGAYVPLGFAIGLGMYSDKVAKASSGMANEAITAANRSAKGISTKVTNAMDFDVDPTIRPVLDLSDVKSGVNAVNGMLSMDPSIGLMTNVSAINSMMNRRIQNGTTDDVIAAINSLKRLVDKTNQTTYNVNGITYDSGSTVSNAVEELVRAARIERRI